MTDTELSALEQAAKAATPGPWHIKRGYCLYDERDMHVVSAWENYSGSKEMAIDCEEAYANARFLELTNPVAILELIAELRQARAERDFILEQIDDIFDADDLLQAAKEAVCKNQSES